MPQKIPVALIYARLAFGFIILGWGFAGGAAYPFAAATLMTAGLLSDIFDGIVARHLKISTQSLRRLDSSVDQIFFICVVVATFVRHPPFFYENKLQLGLLCFCEAMTYAVCYARFKKEIATHSIGAKVWSLILFATLLQLNLSGSSSWLFALCFWVGVLTRLEIIAMILVLKEWTHDVPTLYHAWLIRQGKPIKKHKLFNG